ncbi:MULTISPECIES: OB-fold nucleic acid binding domain-containing protein [unclassified Pseudactinotalea]|uniref:OB-fold nucleic acid binding domain-containing protein n=1 Tax=unclassified Pseudactinotalea TaxID=2649176 RepID=UPI00128DC4F0|nr:MULTISPECIES: OB-fold nucleic acid binding domain-containing protein [unclassified Pseudactinotalea]MPV49414.1 DNA-binding protein [Pseudactinotalea sp. HY160]QGH69295.1 DNA-binding protein [Pseudactinotalea sp. HY158]
MGVRSLWRRALASEAELDAGEERAAARAEGTQLIGDAVPGTVVDLLGTVRSLTYSPPGAPPTVSAELYDGSGSADLIFLGRREIAGIVPGRRLAVHGRIGAHLPGSARMHLFNPAYRLLPPARLPAKEPAR